MVSELGVRHLSEAREEALSPAAAKSRLSRGRVREEEPCQIRTAFQRDRDRIVYSKAFRRLKHKTQVFIAPSGDHYVTRLTHTLQVSQIARTVARALNLNEDLAEAIALGHDLGHTPFGHIGEQVLNELHPGGFRHNEQSLRVVDVLEKDGKGLNLTWEVRDGIVNHSKSRSGILGDNWGSVGTLEGEIVKIADIVAYINHDVDDALRDGVIVEGDLPAAALAVLGSTHSQRINTMVSDIIQASWAVRSGCCDVRPGISMSAAVIQAANVLRDFLFERVYNAGAVRAEVEKAKQIVRRLYIHYNEHEGCLPLDLNCGAGDTARRVVDRIAGMTDGFAQTTAEALSLTGVSR